jgi:Tol biopolymer transport system component
VAADGSGLTRLTDNPENDLWATWWPGGRCLSFSTERSGSPAFYWIKADGTDPQRLPHDWPGRVSEPSVSTDNKRIAFMMRAGKESHIYLLAFDESTPAAVKLTSVGPNNWGPVWSPDGTKIVFYSDRLGQGRDQIFVVNADGSNETQLTNDSFNNVFPSWSPDGRQIIFASNREGQGSIYVMDADGSNLRRLNLGMPALMARWSPDGKKLAFIGGGSFPDTQIYIMNADGSNRIPLTR